MAGRLTGTHFQTLDERQRCPVPAKLMATFKELADVEGEQDVDVVLTYTMRNTLGVFPKPVFYRMIEELEALPSDDLAAEELRLTYLNYADEQTLDKQNRLRIPQHLGGSLGLDREVAIMGSSEYLEITTKEHWEKLRDGRLPEMKNLARMVGRQSSSLN